MDEPWVKHNRVNVVLQDLTPLFVFACSCSRVRVRVRVVRVFARLDPVVRRLINRCDLAGERGLPIDRDPWLE